MEDVSNFSDFQHALRTIARLQGSGFFSATSADRQLVKVSPRGTSQQCPCGAPVPKKLWDRKHECTSCGLKTTRDHASALEILRRGLRLRTETPAIAGVALEAPSFSYGAQSRRLLLQQQQQQKQQQQHSTAGRARQKILWGLTPA
jgi:transposase